MTESHRPPLLGKADLLRLTGLAVQTGIPLGDLAVGLGYERPGPQAGRKAMAVRLPAQNGAQPASTKPSSPAPAPVGTRFWVCTAFLPFTQPQNGHRPEPAPAQPQPYPPTKGRPLFQGLRSVAAARNLLDQVALDFFESHKVDLTKTVRRLAEAKPLGRLPRLSRKGLQGELWVLLDSSAHLAPYHPDGYRFAAQVARLMGPGGSRTYRLPGGPTGPWEPLDGAPAATEHTLPPHGRILVVSDLASLALGPQAERMQGTWKAFGKRLADRGSAAHVVTPGETNGLSLMGFKLFAWALAARSIQAPEPMAALLGALSLCWWSDLACLRALRRAIPGAKPAVEAHLLQHADLAPDARFLRVAPALRRQHRQAFMALPTSLKRRLLAVLAGYRAAKGGLIRDWEALLARHAGDLDAETGAEGRFAAMLAKDTRPDSAREPVWLDQFLASVGTVERAFLEDPAPGFESLAPLSQIAGTRLGLPTSLHPGHTPEAFRGPGAALIQRAQHLAVVPLVDCPAGPLKVARLAGPIRIGRDPLMEPDRAYKHGKVRVENPDGTWLFEPLVRPIWAEAIWKDANGLFARVPEFQLAYQEAGPGLSWRSDDANGKEPSPEGRWVVLTKPAWAKAAGIDRFGLWADFCLEASDHSSAISGATLGFSHRLRYLPPGTFTLGSPEAEAGRNADETEQVVSLSQGFWLGETACTQNMLIAVLGENPSHFRASLNNPADGVNWYQTQTFLLKLNASLPGLNFTLPTEAQWEYACRAGTIGPYSFPGKADPTKVNFGSLWHEDHYLKGQLRGKPALIWGDPTQAGVSGMGTTVAVRSLPPNPWGLYEMHGNVWEWCKDAQRPFTKPPAGPPEDPGGSAIDQRIVLRGGCWAADSNRCRSASRAVQHPAAAFNGIGFRLSRPAPALPNEAGEQVWDGPPPSRARSSRNSPEPEPRP